MRTRSISGHSDPSDHITLAYIVANLDIPAPHMQVLGFVGPVVTDLDIVTISSPTFRFSDCPIGGSQDLSSHRSSEISPSVWSDLIAVVGDPSF